jgi:4-hydroxy-2-oxoheptanedioate aldolase
MEGAMQRNRAKDRLREGKPILGVHLPFVAPGIVELVGAAGFHWVLIDCEHGPMDLETTETLIRAAEWAGITPIVRPPRNEASTILRYLDMGAQGIFVPNVHTKVDAEAAVRSAKYYPLGQRGLGGYGRWARRSLSTPLPELVREANENTIVTVLVESVKGVENLHEILSVPGIDVIDVGPADLSQSLGVPGELDNPKVQSCVRGALEKITKAGRTAGYGVANAEQAREHLERGVRSILIGAYTLFLGAGRDFVKGTGVN